MTLTILRNTGSVYCRMPLYWNLSVVLLLWLDLWVIGRKTTEVDCHFITSYQGCVLSTWPRTWCWSPGWDVSVQSYSFSPPHPGTVLFGKQSNYVQPTPRERGGYFPTSRASMIVYYLEFFCVGDLSLLPYLLTYQSFIYISMDSWIFILYFGL